MLRKLLVGRVGGEPEDQLVEEQHQGVVAEGLGVPADDGEPVVEGDEGLLAAARDLLVGLEELLDQGADQAAALV